MYFIDAVNSVLKRLREDSVATVEQDEQSKVVGELVNDALREVEEMWDWSHLLTQDNIPIVADVRNYTIEDSEGRVTINDMYNLTSKSELVMWPRAKMRRRMVQDTSKSSPYSYSAGMPDDDGNTTIDIYPIPNDAYTLQISYYQRSPKLIADGDDIRIPANPVVLLAYAKASRERGDDAGGIQMLYEEARRAASDAIAYDSALDTTDTLWRVV